MPSYPIATSIVLVGAIMAFSSPASATCSVPNTLTNGQVADATQVMGNFTALGDCSVSTTGSPASGNLSVFSGTKSVAPGNLTGDVTTSGTTATTLAPSGVTAGSYTNSNITVDAKGRITAAANGSGAGDTLIEEYTGDGSTGIKTFSSISGSYAKLRLEWVVRSDTAATSTPLNITFNADTGSNYDWQTDIGVGTTVQASQGTATTAIRADVSAASAPSNQGGIGYFIIPGYAGTTFRKHSEGQHSFKTADASGGLSSRRTSGVWRNTSSITSITVSLGAGNYITGSKLRLYGVQ